MHIVPLIRGRAPPLQLLSEALVIHKVLAALGWDDGTLPQVNMSTSGREDVPDLLLFGSAQARQAALAEARDPARYRHGVAVL